ncbi:calcium-binding protein [Paralysiella testudinis]|uniref:Triacylglycerol lipase n=1 Tax=Paralysiella testudinis TaxID=2809020 RepID=A0A892ZIF2_9NEIS|nr:calcium-binding protein [Paralysiella testudinis]QRQ82250.1 hypothetical protein JQU52_02200 [Paralysiella testudinis]
MFDYKNYTSETAAALMTTSQQLAAYTSMASPMGLPAAKFSNWLGSVATDFNPNPVNLAPPPGWRELAPKELGLPESSKDFAGYYTIASPLTGNAIPGMGPQAKIFGQFDAGGKVSKVCLSWCGTNDLLDIADYFQINTGEIAPNMTPLLNAIKGYSQAHGLSGEDVLVTGYSLGGGMTNIMAQYRESLADGFFNHSDYIGHAAPVIYDNPAVVLNMGYENDVVYRITGNEKSIMDAINAGKPGLVNPDKMFDTTFDNIVLFNDTYASPLWDISPFSLLNIPFGWSAHIAGMSTDATSRISNSVFYQYTSRDSTVVVDSLSALTRWNTWVEDKAAPTSDHHGTPAFIIGNTHNNLLKGGSSGDYIDAGQGDDKIKPGGGADRIDGGSGIDTLILDGKAADWQAYRLQDGTLFMHAQDGSGLKQVQNVEKISFEADWFSELRPYEVGNNGLTDNRFVLFKAWNQDIAYKEHVAGSQGNDVLSGKVVFGQGGHDVLHAVGSGSLLHGGEGNDTLLGGKGNDELYGAEGNDVLYGGGGNNTLYGGVGNDVFAFDANSSGHTVIRDFNHYAGDKDRLLFAKDLFASVADVLAVSVQKGSDVYIETHGVSVVLQNSSLEQLHQPGYVGII